MLELCSNIIILDTEEALWISTNNPLRMLKAFQTKLSY